MKLMSLMLFAFSGGNGGLLDINPGLIFWTVITFLLLLFILKKVAWKPILTSLDERENLIRDSIEKAEKAKEEAEKLVADNQANLAKAEEEAQKIITQGREYAEEVKKQMLAESKTEAKKMIEAATEEINRKNQEAFSNLKQDVADIAIKASEKIMRESLDSEKQQKLIDKYLEEISKN